MTWVNGIAMPDAIARLYTCDGTISPIYVAEGRPVSVGRSQRIVPERTRRIVMHRDKQCRNPLCGATRGLEVHHIVHWTDGGGTDTWNLIALCRRCHRDHHLGRLDLTGNADQPDGIIFRDEHGRRSTPPPTPTNHPDHHPPRYAPTTTPSANASNAGPSCSTPTDSVSRGRARPGVPRRYAIAARR